METHRVAGGTELGHGDALRFLAPSGLPFELFWEVERYHQRDPGLVSRLPSHPQRYTGKGVHPRRFDHMNFLVDDPQVEREFLSDHLGIRHNYCLAGPDIRRLGSWLAKTNLPHEIALLRDREQTGSLLHHVGYYVDSPDQLMHAATILADAGVEIEWGPGAHRSAPKSGSSTPSWRCMASEVRPTLRPRTSPPAAFRSATFEMLDRVGVLHRQLGMIAVSSAMATRVRSASRSRPASSASSAARPHSAVDSITDTPRTVFTHVPYR